MQAPPPMSNTMEASLVDSSSPAATVLSAPAEMFARNYNRASFSLHHSLSSNPLFQLPSLIEYSRRIPKDSRLSYWSNGKAVVTDGWDKNDGPRYSLQDPISNIAENNSL